MRPFFPSIVGIRLSHSPRPESLSTGLVRFVKLYRTLYRRFSTRHCLKLFNIWSYSLLVVSRTVSAVFPSKPLSLAPPTLVRACSCEAIVFKQKTINSCRHDNPPLQSLAERLSDAIRCQQKTSWKVRTNALDSSRWRLTASLLKVHY